MGLRIILIFAFFSARDKSSSASSKKLNVSITKSAEVLEIIDQ